MSEKLEPTEHSYCGTEYGYVAGCRCADCKAASAAARRRRNQRENREALRAKWRNQKRRQREARL